MMINTLLEHVPIKLEAPDNGDDGDAENNGKQKNKNVKTNGKNLVADEENCGDDEGDDDEDSDSDEDDSETDLLEEDDQEALLPLSSDEEAELEAQRIRFHELIGKRLQLPITPGIGKKVGDTKKLRARSVSSCASVSSKTSIVSCSSVSTIAESKQAKCAEVAKQNKQQQDPPKKQIVASRKEEKARNVESELELEDYVEANKRSCRTRASSICSVASSLVTPSCQTESCGNIYVYEEQQKLIFNCSFCDLRYVDMTTFARHLHEAHKLFQEEDDTAVPTAARKSTRNVSKQQAENKAQTQDNLSKVIVKTEDELFDDDSSAHSMSPIPVDATLESCGNIFILNGKKLFLICGHCECKYATLNLFHKHLRQQHQLFTGPVKEIDVLPKCEIKVEVRDEVEQSPRRSAAAIESEKQRKASVEAMVDSPVMVVVPMTQNLDQNDTIASTVPVQVPETPPPDEEKPVEESTETRVVDERVVVEENIVNNEVSESLKVEEVVHKTHSIKEIPPLAEEHAQCEPEQQVDDSEKPAMAVPEKLATAIQKKPAAPIPEKPKTLTLENPAATIAENLATVIAENQVTTIPENPVAVVEEKEKESGEQKPTTKRKRKRKAVFSRRSPPKRRAAATKVSTLSPNDEENPFAADAVETAKEPISSPEPKVDASTVLTDNTYMERDIETEPATSELITTVSKADTKALAKTDIAVKEPETGDIVSNGLLNQFPGFEAQSVVTVNAADIKKPKVKTAAKSQDRPKPIAKRTRKCKNTAEPLPTKKSPSSKPSSPDCLINAPSVIAEKKSGASAGTNKSVSVPVRTSSCSETNKLRYACNQCPKSFSKSPSLAEHKRLHTGEKPFRCDECGKTFRIKRRLGEHKMRHLKVKAYKCETCGLPVATKQDLRLHQRHHANDRRYTCTDCSKAFVRSSDLKIHKRVHTGEKPFVCEICQKTFRANQNLLVHRRSHMGEKNYKCDYCDKRFMRNIDRKVHHRSHTGERPFKCEICGRCYSSRAHVRTHIQREHVDNAGETKSERKKSERKTKPPEDELVKQQQLIDELQEQILQCLKTDDLEEEDPVLPATKSEKPVEIKKQRRQKSTPRSSPALKNGADINAKTHSLQQAQQSPSLGVQQVSVTVSMQVQKDVGLADEPMPEKENTANMVGGVSAPLNKNAKNDRKITSYFTVLGQKTEI